MFMRDIHAMKETVMMHFMPLLDKSSCMAFLSMFMQIVFEWVKGTQFRPVLSRSTRSIGGNYQLETGDVFRDHKTLTLHVAIDPVHVSADTRVHRVLISRARFAGHP